MNKAKTKNSKTKSATEPKPRRDGASAQSERYESRASGFALVKTTAGGLVTETPLSTFTASIIKEFHSEHANGDTRVDGFVVEIRFRDWTKVTRVAAKETTYTGEEMRSFDDRLLDACLSIHPLAAVMPGKTAHVVSAIKILSAPQTINGAEKKTNKPRKGNQEE